MKRRTILILESIATGESKQSEIDSLTDMLITYTKPLIFSGSDSLEVKYDKQFESMCLILSQKLNVNPKTFTVLEYYNAFDYLKKQAKPTK